eukprot:TRINITY_DN3733_c0_g2_i1.p1 TRINITY_DN3733_c0_g2~~TRINITY_DN3733_c0_g2_i1.p1  ORF type:complete len:234 (-),score=52.60 TRINITY_DN3733_c0_g2_i1:88-789(-)
MSLPAGVIPEWAVIPSNKNQKIRVYQKEELKSTIDISTKACFVIGSHASSDLQHTDQSVSRFHAVLAHHSNGKCYLLDLNSTNGTFLNGQRLDRKPVALTDESVIEVGTSPLIYAYESGMPKVRASHLLVKHRDSRRPSSWKEAVVTRTKEEALEMIKAFEVQLRADLTADNFAALASTESHCSSAKSGGDLGLFGEGEMQKAFEETTFRLRVGEMSGPVMTDSGVHLIYRTA